jgi:hypothetical protein
MIPRALLECVRAELRKLKGWEARPGAEPGFISTAGVLLKIRVKEGLTGFQRQRIETSSFYLINTVDKVLSTEMITIEWDEQRRNRQAQSDTVGFEHL